MIKEITSRKNPYIRHIRKLQSDRSYRTGSLEYVCDGFKMLQEAVYANAEVTSILWKRSPEEDLLALIEPDMKYYIKQYSAPEELFDYASAMKNSPGPLFTVRIPEKFPDKASSAILLDNVQDPGNVGTVIRTAAAFGIDAVLLYGDCADIYNPKTVRSTMGAVFRQYIGTVQDPERFAEENGLRILGAALTDRAADMRTADLSDAVICIGNEGHGLCDEILSICSSEIIIPMRPGAESLNAAVAASVIMWEMVRDR